jgi:hypothetical protein
MNDSTADRPAAVTACPATPGRGLRSNLSASLAASSMRRVAPQSLAALPAQLLALVLLSLLVELGFAIASAGTQGSIDAEALPRVLFHVPLALLAGLFIAWREREPVQLLRVAVLFAGIRFWYAFAFGGLDLLVAAGTFGEPGEYDSGAEAIWYAVYALWLLAMLRAAVSVSSAAGVARFAHAAVAVAVLALPLWLLPSADLWRVEEAGEDPQRDWFAASREEVIYAQPALLEATLRKVAPQRPGVADLYFVGVAGYAAEDVFMKEVGVIDTLFRQRFDTEGRTVTLVNNPRTVARQPVATTTALARTLEYLGRVMDKEEDVLFLYLTSHGSEDHRLTMEFWPLQLNDVDPHSLRQMLDRAGIKWRVIAISACYSGGFVEPLRDERTLVVTASDAQRQSFGCGTESDFTYFGRAWDEALRGTYSFTEAFEQARARIEQREKAESLRPSNPQIFVGARVARKLDALSARLREVKPVRH